MSDRLNMPLGELLRQDLEQTKADLHRSKEALHRDLQQTKADLSRGQRGEHLNQSIGDTLLQALGNAPIPEPGEPNPLADPTTVEPLLRTPHCSTCQTVLVHEQDAWVCPDGHGHAAIYTVAAHQVGPIAVHAVRTAANGSVANTGRPCPFCQSAMVEVDLAWDETLASALLRNGEPESGHARVETCTFDGLIWFDREASEAVPSV